LLTPISISYWAMDDGYKNNNNFCFCTDSFNINEVKLLSQTLENKFSVFSTLQNVRKEQYRIYIRSESMPKFKDLVKPHFHHSMLYKLA
jgi:ribosomal protein S8